MLVWDAPWRTSLGSFGTVKLAPRDVFRIGRLSLNEGGLMRDGGAE